MVEAQLSRMDGIYDNEAWNFIRNGANSNESSDPTNHCDAEDKFDALGWKGFLRDVIAVCVVITGCR